MLSTLSTINKPFAFFSNGLLRFRIDDGDGSEDATFKMNLPFFKLFRVYSNSLKVSNVDEFPWNLFLGDRTQV